VGPEFEHVCTGTLLVLLLPQLVVTQLLPDVAVIGEQEATPVGPVVALLHVVAVQAFPAMAVTGVHVCTGVGPVVAGGGQVIVV
jgi:hypothetical protein